MPPRERLSLISRHLHTNSHVPLNTPFSIERDSSPSDDIEWTPIQKDVQQTRTISTQPEQAEQEEKKPTTNMSNQAPHAALLIPGPIEFDDQVLQSMSHFR